MKFSKLKKNQRWQFYSRTHSTACHIKPIDRSLKTTSVTVSKSTEHDVILTPFVANPSHSRLSDVYIMCEIDVREGSEKLALIFAFLGDIARKPEGGSRRRILLSSTVCPMDKPW